MKFVGQPHRKSYKLNFFTRKFVVFFFQGPLRRIKTLKGPSFCVSPPPPPQVFVNCPLSVMLLWSLHNTYSDSSRRDWEQPWQRSSSYFIQVTVSPPIPGRFVRRKHVYFLHLKVIQYLGTVINHLRISHNASWLEVNIRVLSLFSLRSSQRSPNKRIMASYQGALWAMGKRLLTHHEDSPGSWKIRAKEKGNKLIEM